MVDMISGASCAGAGQLLIINAARVGEQGRVQGLAGGAGFDDDGDLSCDWWCHLVLHQREFTVSDVTATTRLSACLPLPGYLPACLSGCPGAWLLACFAPFRHPAGRQLSTRTVLSSACFSDVF